jgi:hypothetical protein
MNHALRDELRISPKKIIGETVWVSSEDGMAVFKEIAKALDDEYRVTVSFAGCEHVITAFLNVAIGQLYSGKFPWTELDARMAYDDLGNGHREMIDLVVLNAKRYFQARSQTQSL